MSFGRPVDRRGGEVGTIISYLIQKSFFFCLFTNFSRRYTNRTIKSYVCIYYHTGVRFGIARGTWLQPHPYDKFESDIGTHRSASFFPVGPAKFSPGKRRILLTITRSAPLSCPGFLRGPCSWRFRVHCAFSDPIISKTVRE